MNRSFSAGTPVEALGLIVGCIRTDTELAAVASQWRDLFDRSGSENVFLSFEWMSTWWSHFGAGGSLFIIQVQRDDRRLVGLAPLYISRRGPLRLRRLGFLADTNVGSDHLDILFETGYREVAIASVAEFILAHRSEWDYIELADTDVGSAAATTLADRLREQGLNEQARPTSLCPYIRLPRTPEEFFSGLGPNLRYNFRRRQRALARAGRLEIRTASNGSAVQEAFQTLLRLHTARFQSQSRSSAFLEPRATAFQRDVLDALAASGRARIQLLERDGRAIAGLYGFSIGHRFQFYQSGMDPAWARLSAGLVLMGCAIEAAIESSHTEYDLLRGEEAYKFQWATQVRQMVVLQFFDQRLRSLSALAVCAARKYLGWARSWVARQARWAAANKELSGKKTTTTRHDTDPAS